MDQLRVLVDLSVGIGRVVVVIIAPLAVGGRSDPRPEIVQIAHGVIDVRITTDVVHVEMDTGSHPLDRGIEVPRSHSDAARHIPVRATRTGSVVGHPPFVIDMRTDPSIVGDGHDDIIPIETKTARYLAIDDIGAVEAPSHSRIRRGFGVDRLHVHDPGILG